MSESEIDANVFYSDSENFILDKLSDLIQQLSTTENEFVIQNLIKKKRKRKVKSFDKSKIRKDNLFKQIKVHSIKFIFDTINELMNKAIVNEIQFNMFYKLNKNKLNTKFKNQVKKNFNLEILDKTIIDIINNDCIDDTNKNVIEKFEEFIQNNSENNKIFNLIKRFLSEKLAEVIKIFNMSKEEYETEFKFENKFLLKYSEKIINKKELINLIEYGLIEYLKNKRERNRKN